MVLSAKDRMRNNASEPFDRARARWAARMTKPAGSLGPRRERSHIPNAGRGSTNNVLLPRRTIKTLLEPGPAMRGAFCFDGGLVNFPPAAVARLARSPRSAF
jgi:hypothetical protein